MTWDEYFHSIASAAAQKSKDSTKIGAVLVGLHGEVRLTAFNGVPKGVADLPERRDRPAKYLWSAHAESNLIAFAARVGIPTEGCSVYTSNAPCSHCAKMLIQAGIANVVCGPNQTSMPEEEFLVAQQMFDEAGVTVTRS